MTKNYVGTPGVTMLEADKFGQRVFGGGSNLDSHTFIDVSSNSKMTVKLAQRTAK